MEATTLELFQQTIKYENKNIWIKPVCDFFNLSVQNQSRKLKKDPILGKLWTFLSTDSGKIDNLRTKMSPDPEKNGNLPTKKSTDLGEIDKNGRILLSKKGFIRWIQLINVNTIVENLREKFKLFQEMIFDFLYGEKEIEETASVDYKRLKKLKKLYAKIGREIQRVDKKIKGYLDNKFQLKIDFKEPEQLK